MSFVCHIIITLNLSIDLCVCVIQEIEPKALPC
jgi:hypothetical protein